MVQDRGILPARQIVPLKTAFYKHMVYGGIAQ